MNLWPEADHAAAIVTMIGAAVAAYRGGRRVYRKATAWRRRELPASPGVELKRNPAASVSAASLSTTIPAVITRAAASAHSATSLDLTVGSLA